MKTKSLSCRLLGSALLWICLVLILASMLLATQTEKFLYAQLDDKITLFLDELTADLSITSDGKIHVAGSLADGRFNQPYSGYYWQVRQGKTYLRSRSTWDSLAALEQGIGPDGQLLKVVSRDIQFSRVNGPVTLTVAIDASTVEETNQQLLTVILSTLLAIGIGVFILLWLLIHWALQPLVRLREDMSGIRTGAKDSLNGRYADEVQGVADDLNKLLFHYTELLQRARTHTGNLAHALKTPLAIIRNQAELLPERDQRVILPAIQQLQARIDYHLGRARLAGSTRILAVQSSPAAIVDSLAIVMEKAYYDRDVLLVNELDDACYVAVDVRDLEEMLGNLIDNAFKWAKSLIRVHAEIYGADMCIIIDDNGSGLDAALCEKVLQRGIRADEQIHGSGLGLNIVVDVAHSYRGDIKLSGNSMGGLSARLTLPMVQV